MSYSVNWKNTPAGNGIAEGDTIIVTVKGAQHISGGVFFNDMPMIAGFAMGNTMKIKLARKGWNLKGSTFVLKTRAYKKGQIIGYDDAFIVM